MTTTEEISTKPITATIPKNILRAALASVEPCRGKDKTRPILAAVRLEIHAGELKATATDSYTLAKYRHETESGNFGPVVIAGAGVEAILNATKAKGFGNVELILDNGALTLDFGDARHVIALEPETYPDTDSLIVEPGFGDAWNLEGCGFNAENLGRVAKVGKALQSSLRSATRVELITLLDNQRPARWSLTGDLGTVLFMIMPMRPKG